MMATELHKGTGWYTEKFAGFERTLNGESASKVHALRREAISRFTDLGFPTTANEEWRFTNLARSKLIQKTKCQLIGLGPAPALGGNGRDLIQSLQ